MAKPSERAAEMRKLLQEFSTGGQSRREFCNQRGIALTTFDYWRQQLRGTARLMKVEVARPAATSHGFTLRLTNGRSIDSCWRFEEEELARLIRIAERD
jgi:hypothetical protein